jgi:hypothetical protein
MGGQVSGDRGFYPKICTRAMKLRILTFNLFFDEVARSVRMKAIGRLVEHVRPAVIGFQEVTRDALALLKAQVGMEMEK